MPCAILAQISTKLWIFESRKITSYRRSGVETTRMCAACGLRGKLQATENITIRYSSRINDWWQLYISISWCWCWCWCWCSRILEHSCAWSELPTINEQTTGNLKGGSRTNSLQYYLALWVYYTSTPLFFLLTTTITVPLDILRPTYLLANFAQMRMYICPWCCALFKPSVS